MTFPIFWESAGQLTPSPYHFTSFYSYLKWFERFFWSMLFFYKQLGSGNNPQSCLYFKDFQGSKCLNGCLAVWPNKQILGVLHLFFSNSSLPCCIPLVKGQSNFYEIRSLAIGINTKAFNLINRKQLNILKTC